jgi:hypothetical protein
MPTTSPPLPAMPPHDLPIIDQQTGKMDAFWYQWFRAVEQILRQVRSEIP